MTTALPPSQVASGFGSLVQYKNLRPGGGSLQQRIAVIAQGSTSATFATTKLPIFSAQTAAETYGFGSPIHTIAKMLFPASGDGVGTIPVTVYPLSDGTTASAGAITPVGSPTADGTYFVKINNLVTASFQLLTSASIADATLAITTAVNAALDLPMTAVDGATVVNVTAKWKGLTGDELLVSVEGPSLGMTFTITQPTAGAGNPTIGSSITDQFGDVWETMIVQSLGNDSAALTALAAFGEGRWDPTVRKPFVSFYASVETAVATAIVVPESRKTDRINCQLSAPGCQDQPWAVSARMLMRIARQANSASPATDYLGAHATLLTPGLDSDQWNGAELQTAVTSGTSTSRSIDGVIKVWDTVTMYHPTGDPNPAYRHVKTIVKLMQLINDTQAEFNSPNWLGKPLIPDGQATSNKDARKPEAARAVIAKLMKDWSNKALISDLETALSTITADIDGGNPDRLNIDFTVQVSGNANVISQDLNFGFFFGGA